jgi:hypothetical protein
MRVNACQGDNVKFAILVLAAFALLLAGCASAPQQAPAPPSDAPPAPPTGVPPAPGNTVTPPAGPAVISTAQLATHNKEADCWVGYDGEVYDITSFIPNHKNYQALIVPLCGSSDQFKAKFEGKHGLSKVSILTGQPLMGTLGQ